MIIGELALGQPRQRGAILDDLLALPAAVSACDDEVLAFIRRNALAGSGSGHADARPLASARLTAPRRLGLDAEIDPFTGFQA